MTGGRAEHIEGLSGSVSPSITIFHKPRTKPRTKVLIAGIQTKLDLRLS